MKKKIIGLILVLAGLFAGYELFATGTLKKISDSTGMLLVYLIILALIVIIALGLVFLKVVRVDELRNEGDVYGVFKTLIIIFMLFIIVVTLFPYLNVLAKALNDSNDTMRGGVTLWPRVLTFENFRILFSDKAMYTAIFVTLARVILVTVFGILVQFMTAYALTRGLKGTAVFNVFFLIPMFISGGIIPLYILYSKIGLLNNFWVYVLPGLFTFYNIIVIRSYIQTSIPESIIEAAHIDGISEMGLFFRIILPLSKPILATVALWIMVNNWNDWTTTLYYANQNKKLETLQYKLMLTVKETERMTALINEAIQSGGDVEGLQKSVKVSTESMTSAQIIVVTLPIIMVYPFIQKYFTKGITLGAVKG